MKLIDQDTAKVPAWAVHYIRHLDKGKLRDGERRMVDRWVRGLQRPGVQVEIVLHNEPYYSHRPAFGNSCPVVDAEINYLEEP